MFMYTQPNCAATAAAAEFYFSFFFLPFKILNSVYFKATRWQ